MTAQLVRPDIRQSCSLLVAVSSRASHSPTTSRTTAMIRPAIAPRRFPPCSGSVIVLRSSSDSGCWSLIPRLRQRWHAGGFLREATEKPQGIAASDDGCYAFPLRSLLAACAGHRASGPKMKNGLYSVHVQMADGVKG